MAGDDLWLMSHWSDFIIIIIAAVKTKGSALRRLPEGGEQNILSTVSSFV